MSNFFSWLNTVLTGKKPAPPPGQTKSPSGKSPALMSSDRVLAVFKEFFYSYYEPTDKLVTQVDTAELFSKREVTKVWLIALELSHIPGLVIWVTLQPATCIISLLYGDNAPEYEAYALGLNCAVVATDIPAKPDMLMDTLQSFVTNGYLAPDGKKLKYTGKVDPKQQKSPAAAKP